MAPRFLASSEGLTWTSPTVMVIGGEGCGANLDVKCRTSVFAGLTFILFPAAHLKMSIRQLVMLESAVSLSDGVQEV